MSMPRLARRRAPGQPTPVQLVEIDYHSASRDEWTTRVVDPVQVITTEGHWYLDAFCRARRRHAALPGRPHRRRASHRGDRCAAPPVVRRRAGEDAFVPGPGAVEVHLHLGRGAQWVPESVPVRGIGRATDGTVTDVVLDVAGMAWFERLLLQLGPDASVVRPPELTDLAARAARKVLRLYGEGTAGHS